MESPRNVYAVKVALSREKSIWREIEVLGSQTLDNLHQSIFTAFDRFEDHLYAFYMTGIQTTSIRQIITSPQYVHPRDMMETEWGKELFGSYEKKINAAKTRLDSLDLKPGTVYYYLFDFGDEWWHELTILDIKPEREGRKYPSITKSNGEAPPQYVDMEEE